MPRVCAGKHLNKMYKAIIFDLDGTLLNTSRDICKTLNASLAKFGCPAVTVEQTLSYVGDGAKKLIERAAPHNFKEFDELYADYLKRFAACDNSLTSLYPYEAEFLSAAKGRGIKLAILTNKPADATARVYNMYLAPFSFDVVVGNDARFALKPDPSAALYIADELNVSAGDCLFVGDGEADAKTAAAAGMGHVAALWGFRTRSQLAAAGASRFANDYSELYNIVLKK